MNFVRIIKTAYLTTINNPISWLFGLFLTSGFNLHWYFLQQQFTNIESIHFGLRTVIFMHPARIISAISLTLLVIITSLLLNSWSKILLVLHIAQWLKIPRVHVGWRRATDAMINQTHNGAEELVYGASRKLFRESQFYVAKVFTVSMVSTAVTIIGAVILFVPPLVWMNNQDNQGSLLFVSVLLFLILLFFVSVVNIFASFFTILYQRDVRTAMHLSWRTVAANWQHIVAFVLLLMVVYAFGLAAMGGLLFFARTFLTIGFGFLATLGFFYLQLAKVALVMVVTVLLALWLALLNSFFNTALFLLFTEMVKPESLSAPEQQKLKAAASVQQTL